MVSVAVIGANGYVGSGLCAVFRDKADVDLIEVTRNSDPALSRREYDVIINCATGSKRFWASQNQEQHFIETVQTTEHLIKQWKYKKFIHISTVSARCELGSIYGQHKLMAEQCCELLNNYLIVRLTATFGPSLTKGVLIDMLNGKVYVGGKSRYAFSSLKFISEWIAGHMDCRGLVEVGAKNTISLEEIADRLNLKVEFGERVEHQEIMSPQEFFPDAADVIFFMNERRNKSN